MPGLSPLRVITSSASPSRSRASSVENASLTIGATSRCAAGKCGWVGWARQATRARARSANISPPPRWGRVWVGVTVSSRVTSSITPPLPLPIKGRGKLLDILDLDGFAGHALRQSRGHEPVQIAVEHVARGGRGDSGAQVFDQLVGLQHVGPDLVPPTDVGLGGIDGAGLGLALLKLGLVEPRLELLHRR